MRLLVMLLITFLGIAVNAGEPTGEMRAHIYILAHKYGLDEQLLYAIIKVESNYEVNRVGSSHKERGLMQLHPKYFPKAKFDVATNLRTGAKYLAKVRELCYTKYGDAWFICYNVGPNKHINHPEKFPYYRKVMHAKKQIEAKIYARSIAQSSN